ncbi:hypothetical protein G7Y89_g9720 [Cudoniella acicularis]|uniref:Protein kinase domain-containing protein n=1 Tax=Cudoniella acicularis TaxID=354080 RepID=A0A8H4RGT1_9HELO|nr:hypothetical protein G7Y89_g9720 [Cudoniella acicularis]
MEAAGLALAVLGTYKEVYLLAKFIHRTISSARNQKAQRAELEKNFRTQILFLQSLGLVLFTGEAITRNQALDTLWLEYIFDTFEEARLACGDYARLAAKVDEEYIQHSPILNPALAVSNVIEFDINTPVTTNQWAPAVILSNLSFGWLKAKAKNDIMQPLHWALSEKRRLEAIVAKFVQLKGRLQEVLPLYTAVHAPLSNQDLQVLSNLAKNQNAQTLGLASHAQLRLIQAGDTDNRPSLKDLDLSSYRLEDVSLQASTLTIGELCPANSVAGSTNSSQNVLIEYKSYLPPQNAGEIVNSEDYKSKLHERVQQLARILSSAGYADLHTLPLKGLINQKEHGRHAFVFTFPRDTAEIEPVSLHSMIEAQGQKKNEYRLLLNTRYAIAQSIAKSIGGFHADGWVHKSLRSQSVVFFKNKTAQHSILIDKPYLVNFEYTRPENDGTILDYDLDIEKDIYRHPDRQGIPSRPFTKVHDLYALGVILLEIGLWQSARSIYYQALRANPGSNPVPDDIRNMFLSLAKKKLGHLMGESYLNAVLLCLSGAYEERTSQPDFSMVFYKQVVKGLSLLPSE